jgi:formyl-CoA transferase
MQDTPIVAPSAPPLLGEHTEEVLRDMLGYDADRLRELETAGAIPPRQTGG